MVLQLPQICHFHLLLIGHHHQIWPIERRPELLPCKNVRASLPWSLQDLPHSYIQKLDLVELQVVGQL